MVLVSISSNNNDPTQAYIGDTVIITFKPSKPIQNVRVTISNVSATVFSSGNTWFATRTTTGTEVNLDFVIQADDLAGNSAIPVTSTTDGSFVSIGNNNNNNRLCTTAISLSQYILQ